SVQLYPGAGQELGNADLHPLAWSLRQPITVDMDDRLAAQPRIFMNDGERRRRHLAWVGSQLCSDGPRQKRLARAKVADKVHDDIVGQGSGDVLAGGDGVLFGVADPTLHKG